MKEMSEPLSNPQGAFKALLDGDIPGLSDDEKDELLAFNQKLQTEYDHSPWLAAQWTVEQAQRHHGFEIDPDLLEPFV